MDVRAAGYAGKNRVSMETCWLFSCYFKFWTITVCSNYVPATRGRTRVLLEDKNAVIYGAGGSIGGAAARAFAREGAKVHLAGRTLESLEEVAGQIRSAGGVAETAQVDAIDEQAVDQHADGVVASAGGIDGSFNLISVGKYRGCRSPRCPSKTSSSRS